MTFALISTSRGDDLITPKTTVIASGTKRQMEELRDWRRWERETWLHMNPDAIPWWAECSVISKEEVFAVEEV